MWVKVRALSSSMLGTVVGKLAATLPLTCYRTRIFSVVMELVADERNEVQESARVSLVLLVASADSVELTEITRNFMHCASACLKRAQKAAKERKKGRKEPKSDPDKEITKSVSLLAALVLAFPYDAFLLSYRHRI